MMIRSGGNEKFDNTYNDDEILKIAKNSTYVPEEFRLGVPRV